MFLLLVRHARAEEIATSGRDADRALTPDGVTRFAATAASLAHMIEPPRLWLVSPYLRARQTAELLRKAFAADGPLEVNDALVPSADPMAILTALSRRSIASAVLVGHEPHLGQLLGWLLTGTAGASVPLKKGMAVGVEVDHVGSMPGQLVLAVSQRFTRS